MRVGVVGFGAWGKFHARGWGQVPGAALVGVVAHGDGSAGEAAAEFPGVVVHRDLPSLLKSGVDIVDIVAPNHLHAGMVVAALEAGCHVVVEKPLATSGADLDRVLAAERASGRQVSVVHELRVSEQWGLIHREIAAGAIGLPMAGVYSLFRRPFRGGSGGWRHDPARVGSWILEEPVHFLDLLLWYFGAHGVPRTVSAVATPGVLGGNVAMTVRYASGAFFSVTQLLDGFEHHCALDIAGSEGALRAWWSAGDARVTESDAGLSIRKRGAEAAETIRFGRSGEVFELVEHLRRSHEGFLAGTSPLPAAEAALSVRVCLAAEAAARSGREEPVAV
jgi:myo-inositol 2-dehydrogenase/D-chiro-inositol 1-dehydrogenase